MNEEKPINTIDVLNAHRHLGCGRWHYGRYGRIYSATHEVSMSPDEAFEAAVLILKGAEAEGRREPEAPAP